MSTPNAADKRRLKRRLAERDGSACFYCRTPFASPSEVTLDHLVPQSPLPGWRLANLVLACTACNAAKADTLPQVLLRPSGYGPGLVPLADTRADSAAGIVRASVTRLSGRVGRGVSGWLSGVVPVPGAGWLSAVLSVAAAGSLTRDQAITAMTIAEVVAACGLAGDHDPLWGHLDGWAAELALSGRAAVSRASGPPDGAA